MAHAAQHRAVILYDHPLLGEGLATRLRLEADVDVVIASVHDAEAVRDALTDSPRVVVFEEGGRLCEESLARMAPDAELIDVSTVVRRGPACPAQVTGVERILRALRTEIPAPTPSPEMRRGAARR